MLNYDKLDEELNGYTLELDGNPVVHGIGSICLKIAGVESVLDRLQEMVCRAIKNFGECEEAYDTSSYVYKDTLDLIFYSDDTVKSLKSKELRESAANQQPKLKELLNSMRERKKDFMQAKSYKERANVCYERWNKKAKNISNQLDTIKEKVKVGEVNEDSIKKIIEGRILKLKKKKEE